MAGNGKLATVFGGSGFVGRHIVSALAKRGFRVRAAVRRPDLAGHLQPMGAVGQIHAVQANLRYPDSVQRAVAGADVVINCVACLAPTGSQSFEAVHAAGCAARRKGGTRVGRTAADPCFGDRCRRKVGGELRATKAAGEQAVLAEFPGAIILRPSIVFGTEDEFFNRFAAWRVSARFLPLIGSGLTKFQPVYVGDLATAVANVADGAGHTRYNL